MKESMAMIYFRLQVYGSRFKQFEHLHYVGLVDFNWAEAWVILNGLLLVKTMSYSPVNEDLSSSPSSSCLDPSNAQSTQSILLLSESAQDGIPQ